METILPGSRPGAFTVRVATWSLALCWISGWVSAAPPDLEPVAQSPGDMFKPMSEIRAEIQMDRPELPPNRARELFEDAVPVDDVSLGRDEWPDFHFGWAWRGFYHQPLYFEDVGLERYGHSRNAVLQPVASSAHFFGNVALFPVKLLVTHPCSYTRTTSAYYSR